MSCMENEKADWYGEDSLVFTEENVQRSCEWETDSLIALSASIFCVYFIGISVKEIV